MNRIHKSIVALCCTLAIATVAWAGQSVVIRLEDGSRWRGEVSNHVELTYMEQGIEVSFAGKIVKAGDLYIVVDGDVAGEADP